MCGSPRRPCCSKHRSCCHQRELHHQCVNRLDHSCSVSLRCVLRHAFSSLSPTWHLRRSGQPGHRARPRVLTAFAFTRATDDSLQLCRFFGGCAVRRTVPQDARNQSETRRVLGFNARTLMFMLLGAQFFFGLAFAASCASRRARTCDHVELTGCLTSIWSSSSILQSRCVQACRGKLFGSSTLLFRFGSPIRIHAVFLCAQFDILALSDLISPVVRGCFGYVTVSCWLVNSAVVCFAPCCGLLPTPDTFARPRASSATLSACPETRPIMSRDASATAHLSCGPDPPSGSLCWFL